MGKAKYKTVNWKEYSKALVNRGSVTFCLDEEAISKWYCQEHHDGRGRGHTYSDHAIQAALATKGIFGLSLLFSDGFVNSIFELMGIVIRSSNNSCSSKHAQTVDVTYRMPARGSVMYLAIDSTGLKTFGEGE